MTDIYFDGTKITNNDVYLTGMREVFSSANQEVKIPENTVAGGGWFSRKRRRPKAFEFIFTISKNTASAYQDALMFLQKFVEDKEQIEVIVDDTYRIKYKYAVLTKIEVPQEHYNISFSNQIKVVMVDARGFGYLYDYDATTSESTTSSSYVLTASEPSKGERYTGVISIGNPSSSTTQIKLANSDGDEVYIEASGGLSAVAYNFDFDELKVSAGTTLYRSKGNMSNFLKKGLTYTFSHTGGSGTYTINTTFRPII